MLRKILSLFLVLMLFALPVQATQMDIQYPINYTPTGDSVAQAIQKFIWEFEYSVYPDLNSIQVDYIGATAPTTPNLGQKWINTSGSTAYYEIYYNSTWLTLFPIASNSVIVNPSNAAQGQLLFNNGTTWTGLSTGTSGQALLTQGSGANPTWGTVPVSAGGTGATTAAGALSNLGALTISSQTLSGNGYVVFSSGLIIEWGSATSDTFVTFPYPFPHAVFSVNVTLTNGPNGVGTSNLSTSSFYITAPTGGQPMVWFALGY